MNQLRTVPEGRAYARLVAPLVPVVILPPLAIDMYLVSLPEITELFDVPVGLSQLSLTGFLLMLGLGQLLAGPLTDAMGRRTPMLVGLAVFVVGSVIAAVATTMTVFILARLLQGAGGATAVVVAYSAVRDLTSGAAATRVYALFAGVGAAAPIIAPAIGGVINVTLGWRAIFWVLAATGTALLTLAGSSLRESLPRDLRTPFRTSTSMRGYLPLVASRQFRLPALALAAMFGFLFAYIGGAVYVYQGEFGLDAATFGLVFGATGATMLVSAVLVNRLSSRVPSEAFGLTGTILALGGSVGAAVVVAASAPFPWLVVLLAVALLGLGLCEPAFVGTAMTAAPHGAGRAAALLGSTRYVLGAGTTLLAGPLAASSALAWTLCLVVCALLALILALAGRARVEMA